MFDSPEQVRTWRLILGAVRFARPLLRRIGVKLDGLNLDEMLMTLDTLTDIQESFNDMFAARGWIAHDWVNMEAARDALEAGRAGRFDEADRLMVAAHEPDVVRRSLNRMRRLPCFHRRYSLALLAVDDYDAGRYHACIPVTLALLDGMGQELTGAGFLRQGVRFAKRDSFLEIGPGLASLIRTMTQSRGRTTEERLQVPFRHGILHGVDLGYANKTVAAKAWGALLAAGSYANHVEHPLPKKDDVGLIESLKQMAETRERTKEISRVAEQWEPRTSTEILHDLDRDGPQDGTPESLIKYLIKSWQDSNFGKLAQLTSESMHTNPSKLAGRIRHLLSTAPSSHTFISVDDESSAATAVRVELSWNDGEREEVEFRVLYQDEKGALPRGLAGGRWLVVSLWPLEVIALQRNARASSS